MKNSIHSIYRLFLSLFLLFAIFQNGFAQDPVATGASELTHKPSPGEFGVGFKAVGLKGLIWENSFDSLTVQFRRVQSNKIVLRADVALNFHNEKSSNKNTFSGGGYDYTEDAENNFTIALVPGLERHFNGTQRIDPFIGLALPIVFSGKTTTTTVDDQVSQNGDYYKSKVVRTTPGGFGIGLDGLVGVNYYVLNHLSIGVEYKLGFSFVKIKGKEKVKSTLREKIGTAAEKVTTTDTDGDEEGYNYLFFGNKGILGLNLIFYFGSKS